MAPRPCIFEYIYFARPDSIVGGRPVYDVRKSMGAQLAREAPAAADVIVPVPDSGVPAALGFAQASGIPYELGIIRNHYVGRTFIEPTQQIRQLGVRLKHSANRAVVNGKRIVLVDDSIVRGTTSTKIVQMMRDAGASEVHFRIASPPITHPDYYGIDTPERDKLLAANHDLEGMRKFIGADLLAFLSVDGIYRAMGDERARSGAAAIHRPLLHRRISDRADRPDRPAGAAAATVAAGRSGLVVAAVSPAQSRGTQSIDVALAFARGFDDAVGHAILNDQAGRPGSRSFAEFSASPISWVSSGSNAAFWKTGNTCIPPFGALKRDCVRPLSRTRAAFSSRCDDAWRSVQFRSARVRHCLELSPNGGIASGAGHARSTRIARYPTGDGAGAAHRDDASRLVWIEMANHWLKFAAKAEGSEAGRMAGAWIGKRSPPEFDN